MVSPGIGGGGAVASDGGAQLRGGVAHPHLREEARVRARERRAPVHQHVALAEGVAQRLPGNARHQHQPDPPEGLGFIIRTAGIDRSRKDLQRDMNYLLRLWRTIVRRVEKQSSPVDIYEESDMIIRTIRDIYNSEIDAIYIDEPSAFERAREFMKVVLPKQVNRIHLYEGKDPIFHKYEIEHSIDNIQKRHVPLKGGGSIVIDQTEALVAIDVNSGSFRVDDNAEETAYQVNLRAAEEIACAAGAFGSERTSG